jgi:putative salt-induced outer membrane protein YdiY/ketosteroid isomerase-like protein
MRSILTCGLFLGLHLFRAITVTAGQQPDITTEIRTRENALFDAVRTKDSQRLERLLAADFVLRAQPDVDRSTWLRNAVALCWGDRMDVEDFRVTMLGDTAVASFELTFYVDPGTCRPATLRSLITDIWVRDADEWRLRVRHSGPPPAAGVASQFGVVPEPPPAWDINAELSFVAVGGNTSTNTLGLGADALYRGERSTTRGSVAFVRSEAGGVAQARSLLAQLRQGMTLRERLEAFGQVVFAQDRFAGIDARTSLEAGIAHTVTLPRAQSLTAEGGLGYTIERRLAAEDLDFASARGSVRYAWKVLPNVEVAEDFDITADLEEARNWRSRNRAAVTMAMTRLLSFRASHVTEYRHRPVDGFGRTDTRTAIALVLAVQRR